MVMVNKRERFNMQVTETGNWDSLNLIDGKTIYKKFGLLNLWCRQVGDELWIAFEYDQSEDENSVFNENVPQNLTWERWLLKNDTIIIEFRPAFPDLPVVVRPDYSLKVRPNAGAKVYVRVPLWVQLYINNKKLTEIPLVLLSKTWFGDFLKGELCYWISSTARRQITEDLTRSYRAVCPIDIKNKSDDDMLIDKICLRVGRLSVFRYDDQLWGSEIRAHFKGHDDISDLEVSHKPPADVPKAKLIAEAREGRHRSFTAKTFMSLKELSGLDFFNW